jgi:hypothetical protein
MSTGYVRLTFPTLFTELPPLPFTPQMRLNGPMHPFQRYRRDVPNRRSLPRGLASLCIVLLLGPMPVLGAGASASDAKILTAENGTAAPEGPADAYYRWIDDSGRVQYTDFEPVGIPAQRIPLTPPAAEDAPMISGAGEERQPDPFHDQDAQILPIAHIGPCADARAQLAVLYAAVPVYRDDHGQYRAAWRGDDYRGERTWLDADDRTAAINRARNAVLSQCSDPAAFEREVEAFDAEVGKAGKR